MTDINEGVNGLQSNKITSGPHDYRKFVIHFFPNQTETTKRWVPIEIKPRPWFRGKARTISETEKILNTLIKKSQSWEAPACVFLTLPKSEIEKAKDEVRPLNFLELRIEEYDPYVDREQEEAFLEHYSHCLSWSESKKKLQDMSNNELDKDSCDLLKTICESDGSNPSTKADVVSAWSMWKETSK
jgi:hypothetical protein